MIQPDIKHKHAGHIISIEGRLFTANDAGMWNLTDIWQTLKGLRGDVAKRPPHRWRDKVAASMFDRQNLVAKGAGRRTHTEASKFATLRYAAWVSPEFDMMVFEAFEAVLEMPEVALLVADKMRSLGNHGSADAFEKQIFNDRCDWKSFSRLHTNSQRALRASVERGTVTPERASELGLKAAPKKASKAS